MFINIIFSNVQYFFLFLLSVNYFLLLLYILKFLFLIHYLFVFFRLDNQQLCDLQQKHEKCITTIKEQYENDCQASKTLIHQQILFIHQQTKNSENFQKIIDGQKEEIYENDKKFNLLLHSEKEDCEVQNRKLKLEYVSVFQKIKTFNMLKISLIEELCCF